MFSQRAIETTQGQKVIIFIMFSLTIQTSLFCGFMERAALEAAVTSERALRGGAEQATACHTSGTSYLPLSNDEFLMCFGEFQRCFTITSVLTSLYLLSSLHMSSANGRNC